MDVGWNKNMNWKDIAHMHRPFTHISVESKQSEQSEQLCEFSVLLPPHFSNNRVRCEKDNHNTNSYCRSPWNSRTNHERLTYFIVVHNLQCIPFLVWLQHICEREHFCFSLFTAVVVIGCWIGTNYVFRAITYYYVYFAIQIHSIRSQNFRKKTGWWMFGLIWI